MTKSAKFKEMMRLRNTKHGMSRTPTHKSWQDMKARCNNPRHKDYKDYGGRGIQVCAEWDSFEGFFADMGERPENMTLDRIEVDDNYCPANCRWADAETQANNKRSNRRITMNGETKTLMQWSRELGIDRSKASYRLNQGYPPEQAFTNVRLSNSGSREFIHAS